MIFTLRRLLPVLFCFQIYQALGQDCSCPALDVVAHNKDSLYQSVSATSNKFCQAKYFEWLAVKNLGLNKLDSVEMYFLQADQHYQQLTCGESDKIYLYKMWAGFYYRKGDFSKSLDYSLKLSNAAEQAKNVYEQANVNTMIAQLFNQMKQSDKGIVYARKAIPLMQRVEDNHKKADLLFKISKRYLWHFQDFGYMPSLDSFEILASQHLRMAKLIDDERELGKGYSNMQGAAYERKNYKLAIQYLDSSNMYLDNNDWSNKAVNFYDLADLYLLDRNYPKALQWADSAMAIYKMEGDLAYMSEAYELMSRIHREAGDYKAALMTFEKADHLHDSLTGVEKSTAFNELEKKYNQEKNEQKIRELSQQQVIYILLAITAAMVAVIVWVLLRQKNLKQRQTILETEQRLNRARMNPHFFFNALASLQQYASRESDGLKVASSLSQFSHVMRKTLESTYQETVTVEAEIDFLNRYLAIQQIRFPNAFTFSVKAIEDLEMNEVLVPSMIVQAFVENSIEHGLAGMKDGHISVTFSKQGEELHIVIDDNGKGLDTSLHNKEHVSRATQIIQDRLYLLNLKSKSNARFTIEGVDQGTRVTIYLPMMFQEA
jgi:two-component sensor histidine kinase